MSTKRKNSDPSIINEENDKSRRPLLDTSDSPNAISKINDSDSPHETSVMIKDGSESRAIVKDKFYLVYGIMLLFGISNLLPWNIFITVEDYFVKYKLNTTESYNSSYREDFTFYVGTVGQVTNVIMNLFNIFVPFGGNPKNRIPYTILISATVVVFQIVLAILDSSAWPFLFFVLTCISVFIMYVGTGIMNSCLYYVASMYPMEYVNAIILGNNLSGIFTTVMAMISKATTPNYRVAAIYYFLSGFVVLMLAFIGYFLMHRTKFYRYHQQIADENAKKKLSENMNEKKPVPYVKILKKIALLLFCIWLNFFSTLAIFPIYQLGVKRSSESFIISDDWFQSVVTFLTFNVLVTIGNMLPRIIRKPGPKYLPIPVIARAVIQFIFYALCNFKSDKRNLIPVLITNDYVYWFISAISAISFGHFTSLLMMYTPDQVEVEHKGAAGMFSALILVIGVTTGLQFSKIFGFLVTI